MRVNGYVALISVLILTRGALRRTQIRREYELRGFTLDIPNANNSPWSVDETISSSLSCERAMRDGKR